MVLDRSGGSAWEHPCNEHMGTKCFELSSTLLLVSLEDWLRKIPNGKQSDYPSSHNHGSVKNGSLFFRSFLSFGVGFHFHGLWEKG